MTGSGEIHYKTKCTNTELTIRGSGIVNLSGKTINQYVHMLGSSQYHGFELISDHSDITMKGVSSSYVYCIETLIANLSGNSVVNYRGYPQITRNINGAARIINANK